MKTKFSCCNIRLLSQPSRELWGDRSCQRFLLLSVSGVVELGMKGVYREYNQDPDSKMPVVRRTFRPPVRDFPVVIAGVYRSGGSPANPEEP